MLIRVSAITAAALLAVVFALPTTGAHALSAKECSAKYQAAKKAGSLGGKSWNDFRKSECGADAAPAAAPAAAPGGAPPAGGSAAVFPAKIADKYAKESPGRARMHTCRDQYNANKANNANGGLKWIQKGGGYYSQCNNKLKATA